MMILVVQRQCDRVVRCRDRAQGPMRHRGRINLHPVAARNG